MPDDEKAMTEALEVKPAVAEMTISRQGLEVKILKDRSGKFVSKNPKPVSAVAEEEALPTTREMTREVRKYLYEHDPQFGKPRYMVMAIKMYERAIDKNPKNALAAAKQAKDFLDRFVGAPEPGDSEAEKGISSGGNIVVKFDMKDFFPEGVPVLADSTPRKALRQPSFIDAEIIETNK